MTAGLLQSNADRGRAERLAADRRWVWRDGTRAAWFVETSSGPQQDVADVVVVGGRALCAMLGTSVSDLVYAPLPAKAVPVLNHPGTTGALIELLNVPHRMRRDAYGYAVALDDDALSVGGGAYGDVFAEIGSAYADALLRWWGVRPHAR